MTSKLNTENFKFLSLKNLLIIFIAQLAIIFLNPSGGVWWFENISDNTTTYNVVMFFIENIFIILMFAFSSIIRKDFKQTGILSLIATLSFGLVFYLKTNGLIPNNIIAYFHPVTLSLFLSSLINKDWKTALLGYLFGLFFSLVPMIDSLIPILFFHIWSNYKLTEYPQKKASAFISRIYMYYVIMLIITVVYSSIIKDLEFSPRMMITRQMEYLSIVASLIVCYLLLWNYLDRYYQRNKKMRFFFSLIPVVWVVPLISILTKRNDKNNNIENK